MEYEWPGNIRELKNILERMFHMSENEKITTKELPPSIQNPKGVQGQIKEPIVKFNKTLPLKEAVAEFEKEYISSMLSQTSTMQDCANILGVNISTLVRKKRTLLIN